MIVDSWDLGASLQDSRGSFESVTHDCEDLSWARKASGLQPGRLDAETSDGL